MEQLLSRKVGVRVLAAFAGLAMAAGAASAQVTYEQGGAEVRFEVFNPVTLTWGSSLGGAVAGQQVEWRVVVSYTGTRTDLYAMGELLYQPTIGNADNTGSGAEADQLGPWRNGGITGNGIPGSMLSADEGENGGALASYGRVRFGGIASLTTTSNTLTSFRHSGGSNGAPTGSWVRIAGTYVTHWPQPLPTAPGSAAGNRIVRGVSAQQWSEDLVPEFHVPGMGEQVVLRQCLKLSNNLDVRMIEIGTFHEAFRRVGGTTSTDDRRYMIWQTGPSDIGSHRTLDPVIIPAHVFVFGDGCDSIDFNRDENFPDVNDIGDYLSVFSGGVCPTPECGDIDFNNDGLYPDIYDIESLIRVFSGGEC